MEKAFIPGVRIPTFRFKSTNGSEQYKNYSDSIVVIMKGINMPMVKIPRIFAIIDLSRNKI